MQSNHPVSVITPANFEEFAGFLLFQQNVPADKCPLNISELTEEMVSTYWPLFMEAQKQKWSLARVTMPRTIQYAVRVSLDNSILDRRKSLEWTFMSSELDEQAILQALVVINQRFLGTHQYISACNPLVAILGLHKNPALFPVWWQSVLMGDHLTRVSRLSHVRYRFDPDETVSPETIMSSRLDLTMYHPYIWKMILQDKLDDLRLFIDSNEYELFMDYSIKRCIKKPQKFAISNVN